GSALVYSTYLGGSFGNDRGEGIAVDAGGRAFVTGHTASGAFPVADAFQPTRSGINDAFAANLDASGTTIVYSSYLGGGSANGTEGGFGIALDGAGVAPLVGSTNSPGALSRPPFPTTADAFQPAFGGGATDAFVARVTGSTVPPPLPSI